MEHIPENYEFGYKCNNVEIKVARCPVCNSICDNLYVDKYKKILGCEICIKTIGSEENGGSY